MKLYWCVLWFRRGGILSSYLEGRAGGGCHCHVINESIFLSFVNNTDMEPMDVMVVERRRRSNATPHEERRSKRQKRRLDSPASDDTLDESYMATFDADRRDAEQEDADEGVDGVVAEGPENTHHHAVNLPEVGIVGNMLLAAAFKGRTDLVEAIIGLRELPHTAWMDRRMAGYPVGVVKSLVSMLYTLSSRLIYHLALGQVTRAKLIERGIARELQRLIMRGDAPPAIYENFITNENGLEPCPADWKVILQVIKEYMRDGGPRSDAYATRIDSIYGLVESNARFAGARKYLSTEKSLEDGLFACRDRLLAMETFVAAMEKRMDDTPAQDKLMARPVCDVGYSRRPITRLRAHIEQKSSNYIMGLCMAIFEDECPHDGLRLSQQVILRIYDEQDAALAETFVSALMQAYTVNGGGFSHAAAGTSIESVKRVTDEEWKRFRLNLAEDNDYMRRMATETKRLTVDEDDRKREITS
ncbi:hypothetical protein O988_01906 [Pseudogymnoascus sp. VKM F-3808]|nr:hypothetical protein O988_01906 [Pseudogymnoascus sp. VKM F-3808]